MENIILLDYWPSPFATRVRIALKEKGIEYNHKNEDDLSNKSPLLMSMNPIHQKIPVLIHNGKPVCESSIILEYIDEVWQNKTPPLFPSDPHHRAKARFLVDFIDKKIHGSSRKVWLSKGEDQENGKNELMEWSKYLEEELGEKAYFGGDTLGFVDIALIPFYNWFIIFKSFANLSIEGDCPNLVRWGKRCMEKESVSKSLPDPKQILEAHLEYMKSLGLQ